MKIMVQAKGSSKAEASIAGMSKEPPTTTTT
jgi:hypothetical protein